MNHRLSTTDGKVLTTLASAKECQNEYDCVESHDCSPCGDGLVGVRELEVAIASEYRLYPGRKKLYVGVDARFQFVSFLLTADLACLYPPEIGGIDQRKYSGTEKLECLQTMEADTRPTDTVITISAI